MLDEQFARRCAERYLDAWNSHDVGDFAGGRTGVVLQRAQARFARR